MPLLITLIACGVTAFMVHGYVSKQFAQKLSDMTARLQSHQDELAMLKDKKSGLQQQCADLEYQLREAKKDLAAASRQLPSE
ncbi:Uncharacterised protein [BD1-7 clade bacterium]|uniref:Uncharacterized protein n=1 Tax=BD1-7 clade bacterium TaxID=2029982 RepID=A0A5S9R0Y4_9GAMM|nr:Uncharacterised protein [BD1-7 clade bacterium]